MTESEAKIRLRNLIIQLCRHYVSMMELAKALKESAVEADELNVLNGGAISGLHCQGNTIRKRAYLLKGILLDEKSTLIKLFGTTNLYMIAKQEIILSK